MKEDIFYHTQGGYKVFEHYIPHLPENSKKKFKIRDGEKTPSASIKEIGGAWVLKDFGTSEKAVNCIDFVMQEFQLSYLNACRKVVQDMGLPIDVAENNLYDYKSPTFPTKKEMSNEFVKAIWEHRCISEPIVNYARLFIQQKFMVQANQTLEALVFPYIEDGEVVNAKNRANFKNAKGEAKKAYQLEVNGKRVFYNIDSITKDTQIGIITEGEYDALSVMQAMLYIDSYSKTNQNNTLQNKKIGVISVSNGVNSLSDNLTLCLDKIKHVKEWIVFVDADASGRNLEDEFIRRIGRNKCRIAKKSGFKDANEILKKKGEFAVLDAMNTAEYAKIEGLKQLSDYESRLDFLFYHGLPKGLKLGFNHEVGGDGGFDAQCSFSTKTVNIITGIPMAGKSTWVDTVSCIMAKKHDWKTAIYSPEYPNIETHVARLINTATGFRFRTDEEEQSDDILNEYDYMIAKDFVKRNFFHYETPLDSDNRPKEVTTDMIFEFMEDVVARYGVKHIVIDPLNKIGNEEKFGAGGLAKFMNGFFNDLNYLKKYLDVCINVIAHPKQMERKTKIAYTNYESGEQESIMWYNVVGGYDIFGGSEIYNQVDAITSLYRVPYILENDVDYPKGYVELHTQKMKLDYLGKLGYSEFVFNTIKRQFSYINSTNNINVNPLTQDISDNEPLPF